MANAEMWSEEQVQASHTPGPSAHVLDRGKYGYAVRFLSSGFESAMPDKKTAEQTAAAPEMLTNLKAAENWFSQMEGGPDTGIDGILVDIRATIAKAEGR